jgi:hypothetical protein
MSKRTELLKQHLRSAYVLTREARKQRNSLRDDYAELLAAAEADLAEYKAEQDDALVRLNARLVAEGEPEFTLDQLKDMP